MSKDSDKYKYPLLMKGIVSGRVINMTAYGKGTVVGSGHRSDGFPTRVGKYSNEWHMSSFKPYKG